MENWRKTLSYSFRISSGPTATIEEFEENFYSFSFAGDLIVNDEDEEEIDFKTLDIENSNENDESGINEKDKETVTLDDPVTNETKIVPVEIIDWFVILKAIKNSKMVTLTEDFHQGNVKKYFPGDK